MKVVKNKVAPPFREAEFDIMYNEGISSVGSLLDLALEYNLMQKRGSWFSYEGDQIAQGRDATKEALRADAKLYAELEAKVKEHLNATKAQEAVRGPPAACGIVRHRAFASAAALWVAAGLPAVCSGFFSFSLSFPSPSFPSSF